MSEICSICEGSGLRVVEADGRQFAAGLLVPDCATSGAEAGAGAYSAAVRALLVGELRDGLSLLASIAGCGSSYGEEVC